MMGELAEYDRASGVAVGAAHRDDDEEDAERVTKQHYRLQMVLAEPLVVGETVAVYAGATPTRPDYQATLVLRLSAIHATVQSPTEQVLDTASSATQVMFYLTPERFKQARLRLEAYYVDDLSGDWFLAGGMYFDTSLVTDTDVPGDLVTYGTQITV